MCFTWSRYGAGTVACQKPNRNRNLLKVETETGIGTVKNRHGSATLLLWRSTFTELQNLSEGFTDIPFAREIT